jgi:hypothetical protein
LGTLDAATGIAADYRIPAVPRAHCCRYSADMPNRAEASWDPSDAWLDLAFSGELWVWRGPSPYHFVTVPDDASDAIRAVSREVTYGWGVIPVQARIGDSAWTTSLFPKDGRYLVPIKDVVRKAERLAPGDIVEIRLVIGN